VTAIPDGPNRVRACGITGVKVRFEEFEDADEAPALVNAIRRDLTDGQGPLPAARIRGHGDDSSGGRPTNGTPILPGSSPRPRLYMAVAPVGQPGVLPGPLELRSRLSTAWEQPGRSLRLA
jgi:hypothetical protein